MTGDYIILNAGDIHNKLGGGHHNDARLPACCNAMMYYYKEGYDKILPQSPASRQGSNLTIKYYKR